jgi:hypothetical protein
MHIRDSGDSEDCIAGFSCMAASKNVLNSCNGTGGSAQLLKDSILKASASKDILVLPDAKYGSCLGTF